MAQEVFTLEQYQILCAAIAQGAMRVKYGDKEVDYRTLADMLKVKGLMEAQLFPTQKKISRKYITFTKGFQ